MELLAARDQFRDVSFGALSIEPGFNHEKKEEKEKEKQMDIIVNDEIMDLSGHYLSK